MTGPSVLTDAGLQSVALPDEEEAAPVGVFSLRGVARGLWTTPSGKAGVILFVGLIAICLYVVLTYPSDFGRVRWSAPLVWANNPKAAPPKWTALWNDNAVEQQAWTATAESTVTTRGAAEVREYAFPVEQTGDQPPQFLSTILTGVTFQDRAPLFVLTLLRPDGGEIRLANIAVPAPRPGETSPYQRYFDTPLRIVLTKEETAAQSIAKWYQQQYPGLPVDARQLADLSLSLFGAPAASGDGSIDVVTGDYILKIQMVAANAEDSIASIETIRGGTVYGWMGTDTLGRNLWEGLLYGFPVALVIATLTAIVSTFIGAGLGIISGYSGGWVDSSIQRLADIVSNVPVLPLLIFLVFIIGPSLGVIMLVIVAFSWPGLTILVRSMVLQLRSGQLVEAAQALGASRSRIMLRHVFPQVAPFIVAQMIFYAPGAILAEASLSFIGLGDPAVPTWGQILEAGFRTGALYVGYWWWVIPPGLLIILTAVVYMLIALGMEQVVDPRLRQQRSG